MPDVASPSRWGVAQTFACLLAPLLVLIGSGCVAYLYHDAERGEDSLADQRQIQVEVGIQSLRTFLDRPLANLRGMAELEPEVRALLDDAGGNGAPRLASVFRSLLVRNPDYQIVRWIGEDGMELVRVDAQRPDAPRVSAAAELQQKAARPFVQAALAAPRGTVSVSPVELAMEHGKLQEPWRPTLRLAMHVYSSRGVPRGIFVLNINGARVLERFCRAANSAGSAIAGLTDEQGRWLRSEDPGMDLGELLHSNASLAAADPVAWAWIRSQPAGRRELESGLWLWHTIDVVPTGTPHVGGQSWTVVSRITPAQLAAARSRAVSAVLGFGALLFLACSVVAWYLALAIERRRESDRRLLEALQAASVREREHDQLLKFMQMVTDNVPGHLAYWSRDGRLVFANRPFTEWFGRGAALEGLTREQVLGMAMTRRHSVQCNAALEGESQHFETEFQLDDGSSGFATLSYVPDRGEDGVVRGFLAVRRDITELKNAQIRQSELNAELLLESSRAQAASVAKTEFLSNMSHEMRSPLNAMLGLCHLAEREAQTASLRDRLRKIRVAGGTLLALINDILDLAKIEAGRMELEAEPFRVADVLDTLRTLMQEAVGGKGLEVAIVTPPDGPECLMGDALRLSQVLINLAGNAVKFTQRGSVTIHVTRVEVPQDMQDGRVRLRFLVADTGIGIAAEKLEEIFQPFSQVDTSTTRKYGGTGLGLAICRRLVRLMGGQLKATSVPGHGSEFWFDLDFRTCAPEALADPVRAPVSGELAGAAILTADETDTACRLQGLRVLVVDDSDINLEVTAGILQASGAEVTTAEDGAAALQVLCAQAGNFNVVLMDIQMPVMDGYAATRQIRANPTLASLPVVALSAGAFSEQRARAMEAGVDAFLTKPVEVQPLLEMVERMGRRPRSGASQGAVLTTPSTVPAPAASADQGVAPASAAGTDSAPRVLDAERACRVWRSDQAYAGYLRAFGARYARAADAVAAAGPEQRATIAHKLRGAAAQLGLDEVANCAAAIEAAVSAGSDGAELAPVLDAALARAVAAINAHATGRAADPAAQTLAGAPA